MGRRSRIWNGRSSRIRSRAEVRTHEKSAELQGAPIHPALIPFPFAFLYGTFAFDLLGRLFGWESLWTTGAHLALAGIGMALVAAVPGVIDYVYTVPPNSSGKRRGTKHAGVSLSAVVLFAVAWWIRGAADLPPSPLILLMEAIGVGLLTAGGWMGGVLVNRNQIGVDPRYARAGKWKEATLQARSGEPVAQWDTWSPPSLAAIRSRRWTRTWSG